MRSERLDILRAVPTSLARRRALSTLGQVLVSIFVLAVPKETVAQAKPSLRIVESGHFLSHQVPLIFEWADNERLVFEGYVHGEKGPSDVNVRIVKVWDTTKNVVTRYKNVRHACYKAGVIRYRDENSDPDKSGKYIWWEGPLGEEKRREQSVAPRTKEQEYRFATQVKNPFHCRTVYRDELNPPVKDATRTIVALREGDGYLDLGTDATIGKRQAERESGRKVWWYHSRYPQGLELPIPLAEEPGVSGYSEVKGIYVISADLGAPEQILAEQRWSTRIPHRKYLLDARSGNVSSIDVPNFDQDSRVGRLTPTRRGWVFTGSATPWRQKSGIYTYDGNSVEHIERGGANALAVSPDGCKAAYSINTEHTKMGSPYRVKFLDFCK